MDKILIYNLNNYGLFDKGYELYLRDFINNSIYFKNKYGRFYAPLDESHGEDDANSRKDYSLDFKRFISQDECKFRKHENIPKKYEISNKDNSYITESYIDMFKCIMNLNLDDLNCIKAKTYKYRDDNLRKELENLTERLLMKEKNIMLYFPKIIVGNLEHIIDFINNSLMDMFLFRNNYVKKDLYFTFIYNNGVAKKLEFVILQFNKGKLNLLDIVPVNCSKYFTEN